MGPARRPVRRHLEKCLTLRPNALIAPTVDATVAIESPASVARVVKIATSRVFSCTTKPSA